MTVALCGATGRAGSRILTELLSRGHTVVALVREPLKTAAMSGVTVKVNDLSDAGRVSADIAGAEALISAYSPPQDNTDELVAVTGRLVEAVAQSGVPRLLVVGGAASLEVAPGVKLIDSGHLPEDWMAISKSHVKTLEMLRGAAIDWTYLSPAAYFDPGERTGHFRLGGDQLLMDEKGESRISMEDYAIAMVDELEEPKHRRGRFTVGY